MMDILNITTREDDNVLGSVLKGESLIFNKSPLKEIRDYDALTFGENINNNNYPLFFKILLHILYNVVLIGGVVGNSLVLYVIYSVPRMRTVTNYLLANLAVGDLIIASLCVPFTYLSIIYGYWPFGHFLCYFVSPFNAIGVLVSAFTLIALAIEKYVAILHPLAPRLRKSRVSWVIAAIWVGACVVASPIASVVDVRYENHTISGENNDDNVILKLPICAEFGWKNEGQELTYSLALMMIQYFIPLGVLTFTYSRIAYVVWGIQNEKPAIIDGVNGGINLNRNSRTDKRSRKAVLLTLAVVVGYTLAWLPYNVNYIILRHHQALGQSRYFQYISIACHWLAMSHCFYNPVIYAWINTSFKNAFRDVCLKLSRCCVNQPHKTNLINRNGSSRTTRRTSISTTMSTLRWKSYRKISFTPEPLRKDSIISPLKETRY